MKETVIRLGITHGLVNFTLEEGLWRGFGRLRQKIKSKLPWTKPWVTTRKLVSILHSQESHENSSSPPDLHCNRTGVNEPSVQLHGPIYSTKWCCFMGERIMAFVNGGLCELASWSDLVPLPITKESGKPFIKVKRKSGAKLRITVWLEHHSSTFHELYVS